METMNAFIVDGHNYFWTREAETVLVWDSTDTLIGTARPDYETHYFWILHDAEGGLLARLNFHAWTESEVALYIAGACNIKGTERKRQGRRNKKHTSPTGENTMEQWEQLPDGKIKLHSTVLEASELYTIARGVAINSLADRIEFADPEAAAAYLCQAIGHEGREQFAVMFLDTKHKLIKFEVMFSGTIDGASIYPREIVKAALMCNASALIISHNHPSGNTDPSQQDIEITKRIKAACELVELRLLDHLVVSGNGSYCSLARERMM